MSTNETVYAQFLFSFGSVYIYELKPRTYDLFNQPMYYWRYKDTGSYYGPFKSIMECTRHWEESTRSTTNTDVIDISNVIRMDFKTRKRIK